VDGVGKNGRGEARGGEGSTWKNNIFFGVGVERPTGPPFRKGKRNTGDDRVRGRWKNWVHGV